MKRFKAVPGKGIVASRQLKTSYVRSSSDTGYTTEQLLDVLNDLGIDTTVHRYVGTNFTDGYGEFTTKFSAPGDYCAIIYTMRRPWNSQPTDLATWLQDEKHCETIEEVLDDYGRSLDEAIEKMTGWDEGIDSLLDMTTGTYVID